MTGKTRGVVALEASRLDVDFLIAWVNKEISDEEYFAGRDALAAEADRLFDLAHPPQPTGAPETSELVPVGPVVAQGDAVAPEARIPGIQEPAPASTPTDDLDANAFTFEWDTV